MTIIPPWVKLAAIAVVAAAAYSGGWVTRDAFCDAAKARADLAAEQAAHAATKADLEAAKASAAFANVALEAIQYGARTREEIVNERKNAPTPVPDCRKLDRGGLEWLRRIAPD
jgi:hypothetical protein